MIVPSIDIEGGRVVQLRGGEDFVLDGGDPFQRAEKFSRVGEIAVIDLDAAKGQGDNRALVEELVRRFPCRVGGGIRDADSAMKWLELGARKVILGTAARPEVLCELPRERVIAAVDARDGRVVVEGWRKTTLDRLEDRVAKLKEWVGGFLVTFVEREGRMMGLDETRISSVLKTAGDRRVTFAGGVRCAADVAKLHGRGADAQVGMALYRGELDLGETVFACAKSDRADRLVPTLVSDAGGRALGIAYSSERSLSEALRLGAGVYESRQRGLWRKGMQSGAEQELLSVALDCDSDALLFRVRQRGAGFCHRGTPSCFGDAKGLARLFLTLASRLEDAPAQSYVRRLFDETGLLEGKLREEAQELAEAQTPSEVAHEAADLIFFASVALTRAGLSLEDLETEFDQRARRVQRRGGDLKPSAKT